MYRGDYLTVTPSGIQVRAKSVEQIGIFDKSKCWGLWFQNPVTDPKRLALMTRKREHCHLIVSPFHPSSWPFLLRVQIWLVDRPGALAEVAEQLRLLGLSILATECAASGFGQATWNIVAEAMGHGDDKLIGRKAIRMLKQSKTAEDREASHSRIVRHVEPRRPRTAEMQASKLKARSESAKLLKHVSKSMRAYEEHVRRGLKDFRDDQARDPNKPTSILNWSDVERSLFAAGPEAEQQLTKGMSSIHVDWIWTLAAFSCHGGGPDSPLAFHYNAERGVLRCDDEGQLDAVLGKRTESMPAIGSFCADHQFLRVDPLLDGILAHDLLQLGIEYRLTSTSPDGMLHAPGMIQRVAGELASKGIEILLINNQWTDYRYQSESGRVRMLVDAPGDQRDALAAAVRRAAESATPSAGQTTSAPDVAPEDCHRLDIESVNIRPASHRTLFLSYHGGHPRQSSWLELVRRAAQQVGFTVSPVQTHTEAVTGAVLDALRESDAMLQVLSPNPDENAENIRLHWVDYEYGAAAGARLPAIRLVDVARITLTQWEGMLRTHRDQALLPFRSDVSDDELHKAMLTAIEKLAAALNERS
jgi:hypothetical protein